MSKQTKLLAACIITTLITVTISMVCLAVWAGVLVWWPKPTATAFVIPEVTIPPATLSPTGSPSVPPPTASPELDTPAPVNLPQASPTLPFVASPAPAVALFPPWTSTPQSYPPGATAPPPQPTEPTNEPAPSLVPSPTTCALDWGLLPVSWPNYDALFQCYRLLYGDPPRWDSPPFCPPNNSPWVDFEEFNYGLCLNIRNGTPYEPLSPPVPESTEVIP